MEELHCRECGENLDNSDTEYYEDGFMSKEGAVCIECMNDLATSEQQRSLKLEADVVYLSIKLKNIQEQLKAIINSAQKAHLESE